MSRLLTAPLWCLFLVVYFWVYAALVVGHLAYGLLANDEYHWGEPVDEFSPTIE